MGWLTSWRPVKSVVPFIVAIFTQCAQVVWVHRQLRKLLKRLDVIYLKHGIAGISNSALSFAPLALVVVTYQYLIAEFAPGFTVVELGATGVRRYIYHNGHRK